MAQFTFVLLESFQNLCLDNVLVSNYADISLSWSINVFLSPLYVLCSSAENLWVPGFILVLGKSSCFFTGLNSFSSCATRMKCSYVHCLIVRSCCNQQGKCNNYSRTHLVNSKETTINSTACISRVTSTIWCYDSSFFFYFYHMFSDSINKIMHI